MLMAHFCNKLGFEICFTVGSKGKEGKSGSLALGWRSGVDIRIVSSSGGHIDAVLFLENKCVRTIGFYGHSKTRMRTHSRDLL